MPKHEVKYKMMKSLEEFAEVIYWHTDGYLPDILDKIQFRPDFIFHYDMPTASHCPQTLGDSRIQTSPPARL